MKTLDFLTPLHTSTKRDYVQRVVEHDKGKCAEVACQWGQDYWDGERQYGYGGYSYDGRWYPIAEAIAKHYNLKAGNKVLDVGCGKAYLLYELTQAVPGLIVAGMDISEYGIENAKEEIKPFLQVASADKLPYEDNSFDLVYSINTFHNLKNFELWNAFQEIQRVGHKDRFVCVESYRNHSEKANLLYWQLTCETFYTPEEWDWFAKKTGYEGDFDFIYFE
ncbi:MAG: methyltransferase domain-containing protein [Magnetovibrio sp.]|nr:methyltransferase domain-containing protein [Magnetovibrio sp.]